MALTITNVAMPKNKYSIKCPYTMVPKGITIHNTANDASAMAEISYMIGNDNTVSYHYAVDDTRAVQGLPLNRNGWHASDGASGFGNRNTIAIEICYSKSGGAKFDKAEINASKLVAKLMKTYGWDISKVKRHYDYAPDRKYCPHRTITNGWTRFLNMCQAELDILNGKINKPASSNNNVSAKTGKHKVGDTIKVKMIAAASTGGKTHTGTWTGKITKIVNGAKYPYLLNNGNIGWTNEASIVSSSSNANVSSDKKSISTIAKEVIDGKWGNGEERKKALEKAGYKYSEVQAKVNELLK